MNALDVLRNIIERRQLFDATFTLIVHPAAPAWRTRHHTTEQRIDHSLDDLADGAQTRLSLSGRQLARSSLDDLNRCRRSNRDLLSICSRLYVAGDVRHLALMDLHPEEFIPHDRLTAAVQSLCGGPSFWLLRTDRHHHVYGDFTMDDTEWLRWNARFQMSAVLVDAHYVGRSLQLGYNALRLNAGTVYQRVIPTTVDSDQSLVRGHRADGAERLALRRQSGQLRRSGEPTIRHLREVAELAVAIHQEFLLNGTPVGLETSAEDLYACGYLHDSIEDTATDFEDVEQAAGRHVADWVRRLSEDKRLPVAQRRDAYERQIAEAPYAVKIVKLADLLSNLRGIRGSEPADWIEEYLVVCERQLGLLNRYLEPTGRFSEAYDHIQRWRQWVQEHQPVGVPAALAPEIAYAPAVTTR